MLDHEVQLVHESLGITDATVKIVLKDEEDQLGSGVGFFVLHVTNYTRTSENGNRIL